MRDITWYKINISLADFILQLDPSRYKQHADSTRQNPKIILVGENGKEDIIIIRKNKLGYHTYFSPFNPDPGGKTIIDFVIAHVLHNTGKNIRIADAMSFINMQLKRQQNVLTTEAHYAPSVLYNSVLKQKIEDAHKFISACKIKTYFEKRCIDVSVVEHPMFNPVIKNHHFYNLNTNSKIINIAYVMRGKANEFYPKGQVAYSIKNLLESKSFKGVIGPKSECLVASHLAERSHYKAVDRLVICESFDDALSHFELFHKDSSPEILRYISTEGAFSQRQLELIAELYTFHNPKETVLATDNDKAGALYRCAVLNRLKQESDLAIDFSEEVKNKKGKVGVVFAPGHTQQTAKKGRSLVKHLTETLTLAGIMSKQFKIKQVNLPGYEVEFEADKIAWRIVAEVLLNKLTFSRPISIHLPESKDFNDDLKHTKLASS